VEEQLLVKWTQAQRRWCGWITALNVSRAVEEFAELEPLFLLYTYMCVRVCVCVGKGERDL
jgi:hypothetical protein